ncbi:MAG: hypothetical protein KH309_11265, partial [Ruminococcus sp.]|nr:hypothetical protein [Ruminococcus sp.]
NCLRNEAHQYNKPQQKAGANTSIILGHFQKRLTGKENEKCVNKAGSCEQPAYQKTNIFSEYLFA